MIPRDRFAAGLPCCYRARGMAARRRTGGLLEVFAKGLGVLSLVGCGPKYPPLPPGKAVLAGIVEDREAHARESWVRGTILRLDGRGARVVKEEHVEPGCHILEVEVAYSITTAAKSHCIGPKDLGLCKLGARFQSGRRHFAIRMLPGRRYELAARITDEGAWVYFVEVDPDLGTTKRFTPVYPGTMTCSPGIAL